MTVKELKSLLEDCNDSDIVVLARDEEGNGFIECDGFSSQYEYLEEDREGELKPRQGTDEYQEWYGYQKENGYEDDELPKGKNCIVLWP